MSTDTSVRLPRIRRIIAARMSESLRATAQLTSVVEVDMSAVMTARRRHGVAFRDMHGVGLSPFAAVARATVEALSVHPKLNSTLELQSGTVTHRAAVNLGIAVDARDGLLVPNVKSAENLNVAGMSRAIADLAHRARSRKLRPEDLEGGTFTLSNTGSRGSLLDTPILNHPEVGILAVGRVVRRPVVRLVGEEEHIAISDMAYLCLTYDHQLIDGADAARFLEDVRGRLEHGRSLGPDELGISPEEATHV